MFFLNRVYSRTLTIKNRTPAKESKLIFREDKNLMLMLDFEDLVMPNESVVSLAC